MPYRNFLLTIHVLGAVLIFGPTIAYGFIGGQAKKPGAPVAWALGVIAWIDNHWVNPLSLTVQPLSGALLILQSKNQWNPFEAPNRWLFASIILYIVGTVFALFVQAPWGRKAHKLALANDFGPEFGATMKKVAMGGNLLGIILVTIIVLMVVKPGSGTIHF